MSKNSDEIVSNPIKEKKDVEYYAAGLSAWYASRLEQDKSLLTLSAGGVGLLVTLMTTVGMSSIESLVLYVCALGSFLVCLGAVLVIFRKNSTYLERVIQGETRDDPTLNKLDSVAALSFALAVALSVVIAISAAIHSYVEEDNKMSNGEGPNDQKQPLHESYSGAGRLQPQEDLTRSFNGAANLRPQPSPPTDAVNPPSPPPDQK